MPDNKTIANVTGFNNGCAAHDFLHIFADNFDAIQWDLPQYQQLLQLFSETYQVAPTPNNFQKALIAIPGYAHQEFAFGPVIRKHMALMLGLDEQYRNNEVLFNQFLTTITSFLKNENGEGSNENLKSGNKKYLAQLKAQFQKQALDIDAFIAVNRDDIFEYFYETGFDNYIHALANSNQALLFTVDEINNYARIMQINLEVFDRNDKLVSVHDAGKYATLNVKLFNAGIHWRYQVAEHVTDKEVIARNLDTAISSLDRDPIIRKIYEQGWNPVNIQPLVKRVQDACNDLALAPGFLSQPAHDDYQHLCADLHLLHWHDALKEGRKGQALMYKTANEFLNQQLDEGIEYEAAEFNARFDALADAVAFGSDDELALLTNPIKRKR
jgi:hypothetical protein